MGAAIAIPLVFLFAALLVAFVKRDRLRESISSSLGDKAPDPGGDVGYSLEEKRSTGEFSVTSVQYREPSYDGDALIVGQETYIPPEFARDENRRTGEFAITSPPELLVPFPQTTTTGLLRRPKSTNLSVHFAKDDEMDV